LVAIIIGSAGPKDNAPKQPMTFKPIWTR
jgi:hypothetical protein